MTTNHSNRAPDGSEDPRLASLDERLKSAHRAETDRTKAFGAPVALTGKGTRQGQQILSALIGAPLGGALIGWVIDRLFDTAPGGLLIMLFLGFGAAISQVLRISKQRSE